MAVRGPAVRKPVYDFDYIADPGLLADCHARYWQIHAEAPPLFWTPRNGGHWVCNTAASVQHVVRHPELFSSRYLSIPPNPGQPRMIPEMLDPPEHRPWRQMLRPLFESKAIEPLEARIADWTDRLLDGVVPAGRCEFVGTVASRLPVAVFMELFGFPMEQFETFRDLVVGFFNARAEPAARNALAQTILGHLAELIRARMDAPRDDMISRIITSEVEGRAITFEELMSIGFLMFLAGLDTVTTAMTFGMRHLAHDEALRRRAIADPGCIPGMVEELMRRYAFVATPRWVTQDTELEGVVLQAGDSILAPLPLIGWDAGLNADPATVSVDRPWYRHAGFGSGVHTCLGLHLARLELVIFYRAWFARVGHFRQDVRGDETCRGGSVMALERLHLAWNS